MDWYLEALKKYAVFSGRSRRKEYWMFVLFQVIISCVIAVVEVFFNTSFLSAIFALATIVPSVAVPVRRLHDIGRTGWWFLISLIPLIGSIVLLVFACTDSEPGDNEYGPNPKRAGTNATYY